VGFALDPDGDRLAIVDADGVPVGEEMTLALAAELVLSRGVGTVVANVSTSMVLDDVARRHGAVVRRAPVGEANVVAAMEETGAVLGGEGNGGVILPEAHMGRDALVGMALVLELLAERGATLAGIARALPTYVIDKVTAPGTIPDPAALSAALQALLPGATIDATDGIKLLWSDAWIHVRGSGTEPVVRIIAETPDPSRTAALIRAARACLARG
jgi:phosphomannomutase